MSECCKIYSKHILSIGTHYTVNKTFILDIVPQLSLIFQRIKQIYLIALHFGLNCHVHVWIKIIRFWNILCFCYPATYSARRQVIQELSQVDPEATCIYFFCVCCWKQCTIYVFCVCMHVNRLWVLIILVLFWFCILIK